MKSKVLFVCALIQSSFVFAGVHSDLAAASSSFAGRLAVVRQEHPDLSAKTIADIVRSFQTLQIKAAYSGSTNLNIQHSGVKMGGDRFKEDYNFIPVPQINAADVDAQGTHDAGIVTAGIAAAPDVSGVLAAIMSRHPELSAVEIADVIKTVFGDAL